MRLPAGVPPPLVLAPHQMEIGAREAALVRGRVIQHARASAELLDTDEEGSRTHYRIRVRRSHR